MMLAGILAAAGVILVLVIALLIGPRIVGSSASGGYRAWPWLFVGIALVVGYVVAVAIVVHWSLALIVIGVIGLMILSLM